MDDYKILMSLRDATEDSLTAEEVIESLSDLVLCELISIAENELWRRQRDSLSSQKTVVAHAETAL